MNSEKKKYPEKIEPGMSRHHRKPRSIGGTDEPRNVSVIQTRKHELWHALFQNLDAEEIFFQINELFLDPDYKIFLVKNKKRGKK